jgi:hypothetical protein
MPKAKRPKPTNQNARNARNARHARNARNAGGAEPELAPHHELATQAAQDLERYGPRPFPDDGPAEIFTVYGTGAYRIKTEQLVPLRPWGCIKPVKRDANFRQRLVVNAGMPVPSNLDAGACFHAEVGFKPKDSDVHELEWQDPKPLTRTLGPTVYCSEADALARYAGGKALSDEPGAAALFVILFLNAGVANVAPAPAEGEQPSSTFLFQRARILQNMQKMFLVCPFSAKPGLGPNGWPYHLSTTKESAHTDERVDAVHNQVVTPMCLGCFASIVSDKREGAPARSSSICGYHDQCRLHIMPRAHVRKMRQVAEHFDLERDLPVTLWENLGDGQMEIEQHRQREERHLKETHPLLPLHGEEWQRLHSSMIFAKPWVQRCNLAHPRGETRTATLGFVGLAALPPEPVLVPLVRGGSEARNGVPWLYLEEGDDSEHAQYVRDALVRISGRVPKPRRTAADDAAALASLQSQLAEAKAQLSKVQECNTRLEARLHKSILSA